MKALISSYNLSGQPQSVTLPSGNIVSYGYQNGKPVRATSVVVSTQHSPDLDTDAVREIGRASCRERVFRTV